MGEAQMVLLALTLAVLIPVSLSWWIVIVTLSKYGDDEATWQPVSPWRCLLAITAPLFISTWGFKKKSLDRSGAVAALFVGFLLTFSNICFFSATLAFFFTSSKATKFRSHRKRKLEEEFKEGGQRNWIQVVCNGGIATELAILYLADIGCGERLINFSTHYNASWWCMGVLGALACASGDTLASELGTTIGSAEPFLITTLERVPRGTNGAISPVGTLASGLGGLIVGVAYYITLTLVESTSQLMYSPPQWPVIIVGMVAGFVGSLIDSLLGALLQYSGYCNKEKKIVSSPGPTVTDISGIDLLDNHSINLLASLFTSLITPKIAFSVWWYVT